MTDATFDVEAFKREIVDEFARQLEAMRSGLVAEMRAEFAAELRSVAESRPLYSAKDLAARWGISDRTVRSMIESGVLPSVKVNGARRVEAAAVDEYVARQKGVA
jgi:excisionase family DNA binding protein